MSKKFLRQDYMSHLKLVKKVKVKWKKPRGRHSKMRKRRKSYPKIVLIGYKSSKEFSGKVNSLRPALIHNSKELLKIKKDEIAIIARIGSKKRIELIKLANEKNIKILNVGGKDK